MAVAPEATRAQLEVGASKTVEELFEDHSGWIYGYCLRLLRSREEAEDALQTTYLQACRSIAQGTRPTAGSAWLLRIAHNVCLTRLRSSGRRSKVERAEDVRILEAVAAPVHDRRDELVGLREALAGLPDQQRNALLLREWKGLSYREIASELGLTQSAVETLVFRARRSLVLRLERPPKRSRLRSLHAFDLAGLLAMIKGIFAGGAGVKAVTAATVTAATVTVAATDPLHMWPDRHRPAPAQAESHGVRASSSRPTTTPSTIESTRTRSIPGTTPSPGLGGGPDQGLNRAARGKGKANAPGQVKEAEKAAPGAVKKAAPGQVKKAEKTQRESNGRGRAVPGRVEAPSRRALPAHATAKGHEKTEKAKAKR
jgi:RNA polymerase sigma factor (sigma-70 family)